MWNPPIALSPEEQKIAARTRKARKFFVFLRERRHELLDATFQDTLAATYSAEPGGKEPVEAGMVSVQVVKTEITPQLAPADGEQGAETAPLPHGELLHTQQ
jgi:hypothetical protein